MTHLRSIFAIVRKDVLDILLNKATDIMLLTPVILSILFAGLSGLLVGQSNRAREASVGFGARKFKAAATTTDFPKSTKSTATTRRGSFLMPTC